MRIIVQLAVFRRLHLAFCTRNRGLAESGALDPARHFPFLPAEDLTGRGNLNSRMSK
jgi:hypothetical protein